MALEPFLKEAKLEELIDDLTTHGYKLDALLSMATRTTMDIFINVLRPSCPKKDGLLVQLWLALEKEEKTKSVSSKKLDSTKLNKTEIDFLAAQVVAREVALKEAHHDHLQAVIQAAAGEAIKYLPKNEKPENSAELPPYEQQIQYVIIPKLVKLGFDDLVTRALTFLNGEKAKRAASSLVVNAENEQAKQKELEEKHNREKEQEEKDRLAREAKLAEAKNQQDEEISRENDAQEQHNQEPAEKQQYRRNKSAPPPPSDDVPAPSPPPESMELPPPSPESVEDAKARDKTRKLKEDVLMEERKILSQLKQCIEELNVCPLKSLLHEAANLGLDAPVVSEARLLCYGMSKSELLTKRITLALKNREARKLEKLLEEAKEDGIENKEVEHARDFIALELGLDDDSKLRVMRIKVSELTPALQVRYQTFLESKGVYPLRKFPNLRSESHYTQNSLKSGLNKKRLVWQKEDLPRSLSKLSTARCGGEKKSRLVKRVARQAFKNIRGYMGDYYHAYPVTLAYEVVHTGVNEEILRDEIFCQIIKQTTKNPSWDSNLLGWKLLYLCVSAFWPSDEFKPYLLGHLAAHAPTKLDKREYGFNSVPDLAYHCYIALDDKSPPDGEPPSMQGIERITVKGLAPFSLAP